MKYIGSKNRISKELKVIIEGYLQPGMIYWEPFVGGANMLDKINWDKKIGSDIHFYLIECLKAMSNGWEPPKVISEEMYRSIKNDYNFYPPYLVGYVGFQLSYGGKWFGGYRRDKTGKRDYSLEAYRNIRNQSPKLKGTTFFCMDFLDIPKEKKAEKILFYCDIPYRDTTHYATKKFTYESFYAWAKDMVKLGNIVLVSEYSMPQGFNCIWEKEVKTFMNNSNGGVDMKKGRRVEKLYLCVA